MVQQVNLSVQGRFSNLPTYRLKWKMRQAITTVLPNIVNQNKGVLNSLRCKGDEKLQQQGATNAHEPKMGGAQRNYSPTRAKQAWKKKYNISFGKRPPMTTSPSGVYSSTNSRTNTAKNWEQNSSLRTKQGRAISKITKGQKTQEKCPDSLVTTALYDVSDKLVTVTKFPAFSTYGKTGISKPAVPGVPKPAKRKNKTDHVINNTFSLFGRSKKCVKPIHRSANKRETYLRNLFISLAWKLFRGSTFNILILPSCGKRWIQKKRTAPNIRHPKGQSRLSGVKRTPRSAIRNASTSLLVVPGCLDIFRQ